MTLFIGSKYPTSIWFNFEKKITVEAVRCIPHMQTNDRKSTQYALNVLTTSNLPYFFQCRPQARSYCTKSYRPQNTKADPSTYIWKDQIKPVIYQSALKFYPSTYTSPSLWTFVSSTWYCNSSWEHRIQLFSLQYFDPKNINFYSRHALMFQLKQKHWSHPGRKYPSQKWRTIRDPAFPLSLLNLNTLNFLPHRSKSFASGLHSFEGGYLATWHQCHLMELNWRDLLKFLLIGMEHGTMSN